MNWYYLDKNKQYLYCTIYNLSFFGYGRHGEDMKISGHYSIVIDTCNFKFIAWKSSDYAGLTYVKEIKQVIEPLNQSERKFLNDIIYSRLRYSVFYDAYPNKKSGRNWIFEASELPLKSNMVKQALKMLKNNEGNNYYHRRISPELQFGDIVLDVKLNKIFYASHMYDVQYMNQHINDYKILRRFSKKGEKINKYTGEIETSIL